MEKPWQSHGLNGESMANCLDSERILLMNTDEILRYRKLHIIDVLQNPSFLSWLGNATHLEVQGEIP